jgi:hypothetical protein
MDVSTDRNVDANIAHGFGKEWSTFRQGEENLSREQRAPWRFTASPGGHWSSLYRANRRHRQVR